MKRKQKWKLTGGAQAAGGGREGRRSGSAKGVLAMDEHAYASGRAKTGEAAGEAPDRVLSSGKFGRKVEREDGRVRAANGGRANVSAD